MTKDLKNGEENKSSDINRGFELMLRSCAKKEDNEKIPPFFQVKFGKIFLIFKREINFFFDISLDVRKITQVK